MEWDSDPQADLRAAAQELYDALELCLPLLLDEWTGVRGLISPGKEAIETARAALAKARGDTGPERNATPVSGQM